MNMACHVIPFLGLCLGTIFVQGMQTGPRPGAQPVPNQEFPRSTILSVMTSELTSVYGNCSFPPNDVLTNPDYFDFLGRCDIRIPHLDRPISDEGVITCLGLLEVGLRLCSLDDKYFKNDVLLAVPKDSLSFNSLVDVMNRQNDPNLCTDLKKVLDVVGEKELSVLNRWNLKKIFQETDESCTRICFDYKNNARIMCKLILWGSNLLIQAEPKPFESIVANSLLAYQPTMSHKLSVDQEKTNKKTPTPAILDPDTSAVHRGDVLQESQENVQSSNKNEETEPGIQTSSSTQTSFGTHEANVANEGNMGQPISILKSSDDKPIETTSKSGAKKNTSKVIPNQENQTPDVLVSEENMKNVDGLTGSSSSTTKLKLNIMDGDTRKGMSDPTSSSIDTLKLKDVVADENSVGSPVEKTLPDTVPRGDEFRDHYDSSMDQNPDEEDLGFLAQESEQPIINQEPTGYKTEYKSPREEFANGNTFLQERFVDSEDSHFFSYFMAMVVLCIVGYVVFHNKQKILALALEGRSKRGTRRRPVSANYHKLDNNLEEAVSSPCSTSVTHVIY